MPLHSEMLHIVHLNLEFFVLQFKLSKHLLYFLAMLILQVFDVDLSFLYLGFAAFNDVFYHLIEMIGIWFLEISQSLV